MLADLPGYIVVGAIVMGGLVLMVLGFTVMLLLAGIVVSTIIRTVAAYCEPDVPRSTPAEAPYERRDE